MLRSVSWQTYLEYLLFILVFYYSLATFIFYKPELKKILQKLSGAGATILPQSQPASENQKNPINLSLELQNKIRLAAKEKLHPEELMFSFRQSLSKYQSVRDPGFRSRVNQLIQELLQNELGLEPNADQIESLWK
jgi:hypothetical protein